MPDRFTNPIVFPDGWRLVIERYTMHSAYHVELHGILVPPVEQEQSPLRAAEDEDYDIARETLPPLPPLTREELRGCVMLPSTRREDED